MAQFWGRIDGYTRGRDGNSHIGDWYGNKTWTVHVPPADRLPGRGRRGVGLPAARRAARGDGDLRRRRDVERPVARVAELVRHLSAARRVGREQQPVRVLDPERARVPGADDRRARRRLRHARRARGRGRRAAVEAAAREAVERARSGGGPDADRVRVAPVEGPRRPRPGQVRAQGAPRGVHGGTRTRSRTSSEYLAGRGRRRRTGRARDPGADRAGVRRGLRVRAGVPVSRSRRTSRRACGSRTGTGRASPAAAAARRRR